MGQTLAYTSNVFLRFQNLLFFQVHVPGLDRPEDEAQLGRQEEEGRGAEEAERSPQGPREGTVGQAEHINGIQQKQQIC